MSVTCWVDGVVQSEVDVRDRGLAYGDGLFETIKVLDGRALLLDRHILRMREGAHRLVLPDDAIDLLLDELDVIILPDAGVLKLVVTRGAGGRGYAISEDLQPRRIIMLSALPDFGEAAEQGIKSRICDLRLGLNPALAGIKHLNRLEQVMARNEWSDPTIREGIVLDYEGYVAEGTMSNVFWVKNGALYTPELSRCGVRGIARNLLLERLAEQAIPVFEGDYTPDQLFTADEVFVSNSLIDVWPVTQLGTHLFEVGPVTRLAQELLEQEYKV